MKNDFTRARRTLILLYLLIVGSVVLLFSALILYQASDSLADPVVMSERNIAVNRTEAIELAQNLIPKQTVVETEYEIENGSVYLTVLFANAIEVKVDLFTGLVHLPVEETNLIRRLSDDFDEMVGWIAGLVFLLAALLCVFVVNKTLTPIRENILSQKRFVTGAAHELRNPLAALQARLEAEQRINHSAVKPEILCDLLYETKQLIAISEGLLKLERGEQIVSAVTDIPLVANIEAVVRRLKPLADQKAIKLVTSVSSGTLRFNLSDFEVVLYNLVHNAIKFTSQGGEIKVMWQAGTLTVADSGIGIPTDQLPLICDRFYKGDAARGAAGSGLGLALVKETLDRYGATLRVTSIVGTGSTFTVSFKS